MRGYKKIFVTLLSIAIIFSVFSGCGYRITIDKKDTSSIANSEATDSVASQKIIEKLRVFFDSKNIETNIMEMDSETLYVGLPTDAGITSSAISLFRSYSTEKKKQVRDQINWDSFITTLKDTNNSVADLVQNTKYKHIVVHMYNKDDTTMTYLLLRDGTLETDVFKID